MAQEERFTWRDLRDSNETEVLGFPIRTTTWEQILFEVDMKPGSHISLAPFQYEIRLKSEFLHVMLQACLRCQTVTFQPRQSSDFPLSE